jgi:transcriptional repressor NrdR
MQCQRCGCEDSKVLESRVGADVRTIRRRRSCQGCSHRFTTYEKEEELELHIRKKDGHIQPYQRSKALRSIQIACQKRPLKLEDLEAMLRAVEGALQERGERVVTSQFLGDLILTTLGLRDPVAYIRFASVYKEFKSPNEFYATLQQLDECAKEKACLLDS